MALKLTDRYFDRPSFEKLVEGLDPQWVEDALAASGTATMRRRRLPAEQAVWLVLGMALYRGMSIVEIVEHLQLALPDAPFRSIGIALLPRTPHSLRCNSGCPQLLVLHGSRPFWAPKSRSRRSRIGPNCTQVGGKWGR